MLSHALPTSPTISPDLRYGITSFIFRAKRPFHPARLHAALGCRPRPGALGALLRLKGFAWLATRPSQQAHAALAGTQFTMAPGPPWWAAIPRTRWPEGLADELQHDASHLDYCTWDAEHGDRRTELVCIGRELDREAASAQLEACLLTAEEMAEGEESHLAFGKKSWLDLPDPFATAWEEAMAEGHSAHEHGHADGEHPHGADDDAGQAAADALLSGMTEDSLRGIVEIVREHVSF